MSPSSRPLIADCSVRSFPLIIIYIVWLICRKKAWMAGAWGFSSLCFCEPSMGWFVFAETVPSFLIIIQWYDVNSIDFQQAFAHQILPFLNDLSMREVRIWIVEAHAQLRVSRLKKKFVERIWARFRLSRFAITHHGPNEPRQITSSMGPGVDGFSRTGLYLVCWSERGWILMAFGLKTRE